MNWNWERRDQAPLAKGELDMAKRLVEDMSADWQPDEYRDSFQEKIMALGGEEGQGRQDRRCGIKEGSEERKSADVIDLTELLKRSLAGKPCAKKPAKKKASSWHYCE